MATKTHRRLYLRNRRKVSIRKKLRGTDARPRLSVFRSNKHIYAQIIDDDSGATLASASTKSSEVSSKDGHNSNVDAAKAVGTLIAEKAKTAKVTTVVFDRNGFLYHGRIKALADAAREAGLKF